MTDFPEPTRCHYCGRELKEGEGRYRLLQKEDEVECCPSCFDATRMLPRRTSAGAAMKQKYFESEMEF